jgi:ribosome-associated protein
MAHMLVGMLEERQASDIVMLDLRELTPLADYFIICTSESDRQAKAIQEHISEQMRAHNLRPLSTEGEPGSGWLLLDYNWVVVHIFSPEARTYYRLQEAWKTAPVVLKMQ